MPVTHLPELIRDLAIILVTAGVVSLVFQKLRQPVVLGYLLVGYLVGPEFRYLPNVTSLPSIQVWAEIGVIFLLFSLGLDFSFRKIFKVGGSATLIAVIEIPMMMFVGFLTGLALGWSTLDSLFLGGMISISSTSIIVRAVEDLKLRSRQFVSLVFGVLVFEDLIAVLLLVVLTTVAVTRQFAGADLAWAGFRLFLFLVVTSVAGLFILPAFVRKARALWNDETTLLFAIGLCLLMVLAATTAGFSPALGAFLMGSILAETDQREHIEALLKPVKNLFSAIFFVSVGMMFKPQIWAEQPVALAAILGVTVLGKLIFPTLGALVAGQSLRTSMQAGMSLAQIGEFSFIIATLGQNLGVTGDQLYTLAVSVSLVTSFTTPYFIRHSDRISRVIEEGIPARWRQRLQDYQAALYRSQSSLASERWFRTYAPKFLVNLAFILALFIACRWVLAPWVQSSQIRLGIFLLFTMPFFWGLVFGRIQVRIPDAKIVRVVHWLRAILGLGIFTVAILYFVDRENGIWVLLWAPVALALFYKFGERIYDWLEGRVISEFVQAKESEEEAPLLPWEAHLTVATLDPHSALCGKTLAEVGFKESFGVLVTVIERAGRRSLAPEASTVLFPSDKLFLVGSDEGLDRVLRLVETGEVDSFRESLDFQLFSFTVETGSPLVGLVLRDSGLRDDVGLIVGIERKGQRVLNPSADFVFKARDRVWIVGDPEKVRRFESR